TRGHHHSAGTLVAVNVAFARAQLWALSVARRADGRLSGAVIHDPARLRPWRLLSPARVERLARARDRCPHANSLSLLAAYPCSAPRGVWQSRPPWIWRRRYSHGAGISRSLTLSALALSPVPASGGVVRRCACISVLAGATRADRPDARRMATVAEHQ